MTTEKATGTCAGTAMSVLFILCICSVMQLPSLPSLLACFAGVNVVGRASNAGDAKTQQQRVVDWCTEYQQAQVHGELLIALLSIQKCLKS
jgi:hypothetical protein